MSHGRFRKRPVVIDAVQWAPGAELPEWLLARLHAGTIRRCGSGLAEALIIETLEGTMTARSGDWVIRGMMGEVYPIKPDIFAATYEAE